MDFQTGVRTRLIGLAGGRVYWGERPQGTAFPAIVLQVISDPRPAHLKDYQEVRSTLVQLDVYATTYAAALAIARQAIAILKVPATITDKVFGACFVDGQRDTIEVVETSNIHRQSVDFSVWHKGD
jgi:hypothetical protein